KSQTRLRLRQAELNECLATAICSSPEFAAFLDQLDAARRYLRTCVVVGREIIQTCRGYCPTPIMSRLQRSEPLEANIIGYPVDEHGRPRPTKRWRRRCSITDDEEHSMNATLTRPGAAAAAPPPPAVQLLDIAFVNFTGVTSAFTLVSDGVYQF